MTAKYTVVQYVPNPTADERMNIGVIVWDDSSVHSYFVPEWSRARSFGGENVSFLKEFAERVSKLTSRSREGYGDFDPKRIETLINDWSYSIQFTQPRGSLKDARGLLRELSGTFLRFKVPAPTSGVRGRSFALRRAYNSVLEAVKERVPKKAKSFVRRHGSIPGHWYRHSFDIVLANGSPFAAVNALSFEIDQKKLQTEIDATAWIIDDVRLKDKDIPLAVYVLPPRNEADKPLFDRAAKTFRGLKADVVSRDRDMSRWAGAQVDRAVLHA